MSKSKQPSNTSIKHQVTNCASQQTTTSATSSSSSAFNSNCIVTSSMISSTPVKDQNINDNKKQLCILCAEDDLCEQWRQELTNTVSELSITHLFVNLLL